MRTHDYHISKMQVEVWKMKEKVYEKTKNMKSKEYFQYLNNKTKEYKGMRSSLHTKTLQKAH